MRRVITAVAVAVALILFGHGHAVGKPAAARTRPTPTAPSTAARASTTTSPARSHPRDSRLKPKVRPAPTTTSPVTAVPAKQPDPSPHVTTTTSNLMEVTALRQRALQLCLEQASANKFRSIAANNAWYEVQLGRIATRGKKASGLYQVLLGQENQTRDLIGAQFTIDESNCYLRYA